MPQEQTSNKQDRQQQTTLSPYSYNKAVKNLEKVSAQLRSKNIQLRIYRNTLGIFNRKALKTKIDAITNLKNDLKNDVAILHMIKQHPEKANQITEMSNLGKAIVKPALKKGAKKARESKIKIGRTRNLFRITTSPVWATKKAFQLMAPNSKAAKNMEKFYQKKVKNVQLGLKEQKNNSRNEQHGLEGMQKLMEFKTPQNSLRPSVTKHQKYNKSRLASRKAAKTQNRVTVKVKLP